MLNKASRRDFLFGCDQNMVDAMGVVWGGIHKHMPEETDLVFHARLIGVNEKKKREMKSWCRRRKIVLHLYDHTGIKLRSKVVSHLPDSSWLRLIELQSLVEIPEKLVYLDCDTVILGSLEHLFQIPLGEYPCAACDDPSWGLLPRKLALGMTAEMVYFNSGVMLINTRVWVRDKIAEKAQVFLHENPDVCPYDDQDSLNATLKGNFLPLQDRYNRFALFEQTCRDWEKKFAIIHFAWKDKPWHFHQPYPHYYEFSGLYFEQAKRGFRPIWASIRRWACIFIGQWITGRGRFTKIRKKIKNKIKKCAARLNPFARFTPA
jgi:lipopolysaccharide biosynthesis glycosyltransferase